MSKRFKWQWAVITPPPNRLSPPVPREVRMELEQSRNFLVLIVKVFVIKFAIFYRKCFVLCIIYTSSLNALLQIYMICLTNKHK